MELVICSKCLIRNYIPEDREYIFEGRKEGYRIKTIEDVDKFIHLNKDVDFASLGMKCCAIANEERIIGELYLSIKESEIVLDYFLYQGFDKPTTAVDMLVSVIRQLHKVYKYSIVLYFVYKENFKIRSILESLNFERISLNRENNLYTYRLYRPYSK